VAVVQAQMQAVKLAVLEGQAVAHKARHLAQPLRVAQEMLADLVLLRAQMVAQRRILLAIMLLLAAVAQVVLALIFPAMFQRLALEVLVLQALLQERVLFMRLVVQVAATQAVLGRSQMAAAWGQLQGEPLQGLALPTYLAVVAAVKTEQAVQAVQASL
tara:strand:+ start:659 stop:1135 length:477 start_codon:yes stop_codon:yes gene_type:complete